MNFQPQDLIKKQFLEIKNYTESYPNVFHKIYLKNIF